MSDRPLRLRTWIVLGAVGFVVLALALAFTSARRFLSQSLTSLVSPERGAEIAHRFDVAFVAVAVLGLVLTVVLALFTATFAVRTLAGLRRLAQDRARGESATQHVAGPAEVRAVAAAIDQLATGLETDNARLRGERDEVSSLVESVSEGIVFVDADGRIILANTAACTLIGLPDPCRGRSLVSLIRNAQLRTIMSRALEGTVLTDEIAFDDRRLMVRARPAARDANEATVDRRVVITIVDLTELRRLEGVRRDFVANVSHELKTPLTSIMGYAETLLSDDLPQQTRKQFLAVVHDNAHRLHALVEDLLDLSRLESAGWQPRFETVDVAATARAAWGEYQERAAAGSIRFEEPPHGVTVRADPAALRQILANLFDNAIRHTPRDGTIRVHAEDASGQHADPAPRVAGVVTIDVEDTGSGIPPDALPRIFERFFRVDPARSRSEGGTGLGLSIVRHLTEAMGGTVSAESQLGRGTRIRLRLPSS